MRIRTDKVRLTGRFGVAPVWLLLLAVGALFGALGMDSTARPGTHPSPEDWRDYDLVAYSQPAPEALRDVTLTSLPTGVWDASELAGLPMHRSPHGTALCVMRVPDTTRHGPWATTIHVFGNKARPLHLQIDIANHISAGVRASWINEKLLWLQVWRGRIVSTDLILNVEKAQFLYSEEANYGVLIQPRETHEGAKE